MNTSTIIMVIAIIIFLILPTLKPRTINIRRLFILPAVFIYFLYNSLTENFHIASNDYLIIGVGILAGVSAGIFSRTFTPIQIDKRAQTISMPGSYLNLVTFILIFSTHYLMGYLNAVDKGFFSTESMGLSALLFLLTFASTLSAGGNLLLLYRYSSTKEFAC